MFRKKFFVTKSEQVSVMWCLWYVVFVVSMLE